MLTPKEDVSRAFIALVMEEAEGKLLALSMGAHWRLGEGSSMRGVGALELLAMVGDAFWGSATSAALGRFALAPTHGT